MKTENTEQEWIVDRLPTKEDAQHFSDYDNQIARPTDEPGWLTCHYGNVQAGEPWAPIPKMPPYVPKKTREQIAKESLPKGMVFLGLGEDLRKGDYESLLYWSKREERWASRAYPSDPPFKEDYYAAPYDSEITKLNNLGKWDKTGLPEPPDGWDAYEDHGWGGISGRKEAIVYYRGDDRWSDDKGPDGATWVTESRDEYHLTPKKVKKTPEEWFQELPESIRDRAVANIDRDFYSYTRYLSSLIRAIDRSFDWKISVEGQDYWRGIRSDLNNGTPPSELKDPLKKEAEPKPTYRLMQSGVGGKVVCIADEKVFSGLSLKEAQFKLITYYSCWIENELTGERVEPETEYWSKPEHFPPVCWMMPRNLGDELREVSQLATNVSLKGFALQGLWCEYDDLELGDNKGIRWSDRPFSNWEDGLPCLVDENEK